MGVTEVAGRRPAVEQAESGVAELTVVVPAYNERDGLRELLAEIERACDSIGRPWEVIFVDDGSTDGSRELLEELAADHDAVRVVSLRRNFGKSAALSAGFEHSAGEIVVTLDGDGQDDPAEIPALVGKLDDGYQLVSGWKRDRQDPRVRRWASRLFNGVTARLSGVRLHDFNCGLKAYRGDCARSLRIYGELHRYIPVLAVQRGWRVAELPVHHRARRHGRSKFGFERYARGPFDLLGVLFIGRYQYRPLHLFGGLGVALMLAGVLISLYLALLRFSGEAIGDRPLLLLGALLIVVGFQLLTFGLLGQMLVVMRQERVAASTADQVERVTGTGPPRTP
ncbi:MAG: glycosyltransferase family 2 protein [Solirubrobacterales bacterium]